MIRWEAGQALGVPEIADGALGAGPEAPIRISSWLLAPMKTRSKRDVNRIAIEFSSSLDRVQIAFSKRQLESLNSGIRCLQIKFLDSEFFGKDSISEAETAILVWNEKLKPKID